MRRLAALVVALAPLLLAALPAPASAGEDELVGLHVEGPAWRADDVFWVDWEGPADDELGYRFLRIPWAQETVNAGEWHETRAPVSIPLPPRGERLPSGEYVLEMWLWKHGAIGEHGPTSQLVLRYDNLAPTAPEATGPSAWLDARNPISVSIGPSARVPPSGIGGYAVSISGRPDESPCAERTRCSGAELDLAGGTDVHQLQLGQLPEGVNYLNVVTVSGSGVASTPTSVPIHVDLSAPTVRFAGLPAGWSDAPVTITAIAEDPFSGVAASGSNGPFTALAIDGGVPTLGLGNSATATVSGEGTHVVSGWGRDFLGNAGDATTAQTATVRIDETPPRVAFAAAQRPDDPELIELRVTDVLSGPSADRGSVEIRPASTTQRFQPLPTTATGGGLAAHWSSDDFPAGSYEFRATGFDAAGNPAITDRRVDGSPMVLRNPIKIPTAIESGFGGAKLLWQHCHRVHGGRRCRRRRN